MRKARVLPLFGLCAAALLGVMAWLTASVRRLDEAERRGREQAALEESVRLALWRMESLLAPLIAQENARSPASYRSPAGAARQVSPYVRLHFQWDARGRLSTVVPPSAEVQAAGTGTPPRREGELRQAAARLTDRQALLARLSSEWLQTESMPLAEEAPKLKADLPAFALAPEKASATPSEPKRALAQKADTVPEIPPKKAAATPREQQQALSESEYQARAANLALLRDEGRKAIPRLALAPARSKPVRLGLLQPLWLGHELVLARRVLVGEQLLVQVCWLDWPELRAAMLAAVQDLLPDARLEPAGDADDPARRLAAMPVKLVPGRPAVLPAPLARGEWLPMGIAWGLAALALAATGALLLGLATLGERRAAFVSAVTHELRTPLTTFRMYADMLGEGMVPRGHEREYLDTLRREAERQAHLVENVLAYSRLERGRYRAARETLALDDLVAGLRDSLSAQAERAGMTLVAPDVGEWRTVAVAGDGVAARDHASLSSALPSSHRPTGAGAPIRVVVDRAAVERVLFNLVDNACKYARHADDRRIHLEWRVEDRAALLCVRDHGLGVSRKEARRLFRPFHKSARDAAQSAPGVGLGLALSRRLARAIGGDLRLASTDGPGACFCLRLPRA